MIRSVSVLRFALSLLALGCEARAEERECRDFIAAVEECSRDTPYADDGEEHLLFLCTESCYVLTGARPGCLDKPTNETIDRWVDDLRDDCESFAATWAPDCEGEFSSDAVAALQNACLAFYFSMDPIDLPLCAAGLPETDAIASAESCE